MRGMKRIGVFALALLMAGAAAHAKGTGEKGEAGKAAPFEVTMTIRDRSSIVWEGSDLQKLVADRFGLLVKMDIIDASAYAEKFKIRFNSGDLPDIANNFGLSVEQMNEAGDRGMLLNILAYADRMPDLKKMLVTYKDDLRFYVSDKRALYFTPLVIPMVYGYFGLGVRADLLQKAGVDPAKVTEFSDLTALFQALKRMNGDKVPLGSRTGLNTLTLLGEYMGITRDAAWWNHETQKWEPTYGRPGMRDFVKLMASYYAQGILHPDFLTMQSKEWSERMYNGELTAFMDNLAFLDNNTLYRKSPEMTWVHVVPPKYDGKQYATRTLPSLSTGQGKIVSARTKAAPQIMSFLNWLYTQEGNMRTQFGIEGKDHIAIGDGKWIEASVAFKAKISEKYQGQLQSVEEYNRRQDQVPFNMNGLYCFTTPWRMFGRTRNEKGPSYQQASFEEYVARSIYRSPDPATPFGAAQLEEIKQLREPIQTYGDETVTKMILGQLPIDANWDGFQKRLKELKYGRLIELQNQSYATFQGRTVDLK